MIVGTGPYEFVEWEAADRIRLERYDDYDWGPISPHNSNRASKRSRSESFRRHRH
ncbi:hypothetical protein D8S78_22315 [Natrialba swarupiae]|nr:hypothetical protein [Natrialba swarupiae]